MMYVLPLMSCLVYLLLPFCNASCEEKQSEVYVQIITVKTQGQLDQALGLLHGDQDFSDSQASTTMLTTRLIPAPLSQGSRGGSALRLSLIIWIGGDRRWMVRLEQTGCLDNFCWLAQGISVR